MKTGEKPFVQSQLKFLCYGHCEECWTQFYCNNCIHHFKTKFVLIHHRMPQHAETSTLVITSFITLTQSLFLWIMEWPNMQKTVFLPSLHVTLQNKICFYESWNCTPCILRTLNKQLNTIKNNSIVFPWQRWIFSYNAINNWTSATEVSDFGKNNAKTTPCQYCNNTFNRKSVFTGHIEQNISESKWTGPLSSVVGVTSELVADLTGSESMLPYNKQNTTQVLREYIRALSRKL